MGRGSISLATAAVLVTTHPSQSRTYSQLRIFDLETQEEHALLPDDSRWDDRDAPSVVTSPDGELLAAAVPNRKGHPLEAWPRLVDWLDRIGINMHPDESFVSLIRTASGEELFRLPSGPSRPFAPRCPMRSLGSPFRPMADGWPC